MNLIHSVTHTSYEAYIHRDTDTHTHTHTHTHTQRETDTHGEWRRTYK